MEMLIGESCTFRKRTFRVGPCSTVITIPRAMEIDAGDTVEVTVTLIEKHKNTQENESS